VLGEQAIAPRPSDTATSLPALFPVAACLAVRTALQNAGSIASLMLTTEALVAEIQEDQRA